MLSNKYKNKIIGYSIKKINFKIITFVILIILSIISIICIPKEILSKNFIYHKAISMAYIEERDDIALYNYKVYATQEKFNQHLDEDINIVRDKFREDLNLLLVVLPGSGEEVHYKDYILQYNDNIPKLNIEFYYIKYIKYNDKIFAADTFLTVAVSISKKINIVYFSCIIILHLIVFLFGIRKLIYLILTLNKKSKLNIK